MDKDFTTIDYLVDGNIEHVVFLEDICKEFNLNVTDYWVREATKEDWFATGEYVVKKTKPIPELINEYEHAYSILIDENNRDVSLFADKLIDGLINVWSYLEGCLEKEIDNKKGDTS